MAAITNNAADALLDFVNGGQHEEFEKFVEEIVSRHRTLQQNTFRLMMAVIKRWSEVPYGQFDDRNEQTVTLSKKIMEAVGDELYIPYI